MAVKSYKDLEVWKQAMDLVVLCYDLSCQFPAPERIGLTSQLRRAAVAIPANIAEGQGRRYPKEFVRFLLIARGSLAELETHVRISTRLTYLSPIQEATILTRTATVGRLLNGLLKSLETS